MINIAKDQKTIYDQSKEVKKESEILLEENKNDDKEESKEGEGNINNNNQNGENKVEDPSLNIQNKIKIEK